MGVSGGGWELITAHTTTPVSAIKAKAKTRTMRRRRPPPSSSGGGEMAAMPLTVDCMCGASTGCACGAAWGGGCETTRGAGGAGGGLLAGGFG